MIWTQSRSWWYAKSLSISYAIYDGLSNVEVAAENMPDVFPHKYHLDNLSQYLKRIEIYAPDVNWTLVREKIQTISEAYREMCFKFINEHFLFLLS